MNRAAAAVLCVIFGLAVSTVLDPPVPPPRAPGAGAAVAPRAARPTRGQSRTRLVADDPDRNWVAVWSVGGNLDGPFVWTTPTGLLIPADTFRPERSSDPFQRHYYLAARLPTNAQPGTWRLDCGRGPEWSFLVNAAPAGTRTTWTAPGTATAADVSNHLAAGLNGQNVKLSGDYDWTEPVIVPVGVRRITAYGATVRGGGPAPGTGIGCLFAGGTDLTIEGGTFYPTGVVHHCPPAGALARPVYRQLKITGGPVAPFLHYTPAEVLADECTFDRCTNLAPPSGLWLRCLWTGRGLDACFRRASTAAGDLALIDGTFERTDRGPVFQTGDAATPAPVTDCLIASLQTFGVAKEVNGCESVVLAEGVGEFSRNLVLSARVTGGVGMAVNLDCPAFDNFFQDLYSDSPGQGCFLWGGPTQPQERNLFVSCEWAGTIYCGPWAKNNEWQGCGQRYFGASRANQGGDATNYYDALTAVAAVGPGAKTNKLTGHRWFVGDGMTAAAGVTLSGCRCNGKPVADRVATLALTPAAVRRRVGP